VDGGTITTLRGSTGLTFTLRRSGTEFSHCTGFVISGSIFPGGSVFSGFALSGGLGRGFSFSLLGSRLGRSRGRFAGSRGRRSLSRSSSSSLGGSGSRLSRGGSGGSLHLGLLLLFLERRIFNIQKSETIHFF